MYMFCFFVQFFHDCLSVHRAVDEDVRHNPATSPFYTGLFEPLNAASGGSKGRISANSAGTSCKYC